MLISSLLELHFLIPRREVLTIICRHQVSLGIERNASFLFVLSLTALRSVIIRILFGYFIGISAVCHVVYLEFTLSCLDILNLKGHDLLLVDTFFDSVAILFFFVRT